MIANWCCAIHPEGAMANDIRTVGRGFHAMRLDDSMLQHLADSRHGGILPGDPWSKIARAELARRSRIG
jgi:hypothetical protein